MASINKYHWCMKLLKTFYEMQKFVNDDGCFQKEYIDKYINSTKTLYRMPQNLELVYVNLIFKYIQLTNGNLHHNLVSSKHCT